MKKWATLIMGIAALPLTARDVVSLFEAALADPAPTRTEIYKQIAGNDLQARIFEPGEGVERNGSTILWIHGGGWKQGSADQLFPQAAYFSQLGYLNISIDYRLAGESSTIFACLSDCRDAFYWVVENAGDLGIDPDKIIVAGESSGGHLAACVGIIKDSRTLGIPDPQPWPAAVIPINPIMDLTSISWAMRVPGLQPDAVDLAKSISPQYHVPKASVPALLLHGSADGVVPPEQSIDFADTMHRTENIARLRLWEGKSHAFFLYLPKLKLMDKPVIHSSLLEIEAFLQSLGLAGGKDNFSAVHLFGGADGFRSFSELVSINGKLYGSTYKGGPQDCGVVFRFDPVTRDYDILHAFNGEDGREIFTGLATDGNRIYGVGKFGGTYNSGVLFSMGLDGSYYAVLHHFNNKDKSGFGPHASPILVDGALYGTVYHGGTTGYGGALYKYSLPDGPYELVHSFTPETGRHPTGQMIQVGEWLYGTASDLFEHKDGHFGSLFRYRWTDHAFEVLHRFDDATEGSHPYDDLVYDGSDALIGTTLGQAFNPASKGTIFSYSLSRDELIILHDFAQNPGTGSKPNSALIAIDDSGYFYGITHGSNADGGDLGNIFRIHKDGSGFQIYHVFDDGLRGNTPMRSLTYLDGALYGVTAFGGLTTDTDNPETGPGMIFRYRLDSEPRQ